MDSTIIAAIIGAVAVIVAAYIQRGDTGRQRRTRSSDVDNQQASYSQHEFSAHKVKRYWIRGLGVLLLAFYLGNIVGSAIYIGTDNEIVGFFLIILIWAIGLYVTYRVWKG